MHLAAHLAAIIAVVSTGVVYGTDVFCALVQRPALARVDDAALTLRTAEALVALISCPDGADPACRRPAR